VVLQEELFFFFCCLAGESQEKETRFPEVIKQMMKALFNE